MKVVILHPPLYPVNHQLFDLLGKTVDLTVYNFGEHPRLHPSWSVHAYNNKNYKIKVFGSGAISLKKQINPSFLYHLQVDKPDIVISVAFWVPSLYASIFKGLLGFKLIVSTDAISSTEEGIPKLKQLMRRFICSRVDGFISASSLTYKYLESLSPNVSNYISLQTIDTSGWRKKMSTLPPGCELRLELGIPLDKKIILGVGGFIAIKNWESIIFKINQLTDCILILIGSGELREQYMEYIVRDDLQESVFVLSRKSGLELQKYFKVSDLFIFPSLCDRFGYVVVEALCSGLPVICSKAAGASSIIVEASNGYVVEPNKCFVAEVDLVISRLDIFKKNALSSIKNYTLENKADEYMSILRDVYEK